LISMGSGLVRRHAVGILNIVVKRMRMVENVALFRVQRIATCASSLNSDTWGREKIFITLYIGILETCAFLDLGLALIVRIWFA